MDVSSLDSIAERREMAEGIMRSVHWFAAVRGATTAEKLRGTKV